MQNNNDMIVPRKENVVRFFFLGMVIFLLTQVVFMYGGMFVENNMHLPITGIPSAIGLTLVLIIGLLVFKKSEYVLLGSFSLAFVSPLILDLIVRFKFMNFTAPHIYYAIGYMIAVILFVWGYFVRKILKEEI